MKGIWVKLQNGPVQERGQSVQHFSYRIDSVSSQSFQSHAVSSAAYVDQPKHQVFPYFGGLCRSRTSQAAPYLSLCSPNVMISFVRKEEETAFPSSVQPWMHHLTSAMKWSVVSLCYINKIDLTWPDTCGPPTSLTSSANPKTRFVKVNVHKVQVTWILFVFCCRNDTSHVSNNYVSVLPVVFSR